MSDRARILDHFREQAGFCRMLGSPFTAALIDAMADDIAGDGVVADLVGAWASNPRAEAVSLRLAGALHFAVLTLRDPGLAAVYPSANPNWRIETVWPFAQAFLRREAAFVRSFLESAPQTNETRRTIGLLPGFLHLSARFGLPLDLLELGASAGLNQVWDRFHYRTAGWAWGPANGPVIDTDWTGAVPHVEQFPIVRSRRACDLRPIDLEDADARARLKSYVWADQPDRLARLDGAVAMARAAGVKVEAADAEDWIKACLAQREGDGVTVVFHSVFYQYPPSHKRQAIADAIEVAGAAATAQAPLAWLRYEPEPLLIDAPDSIRFIVDLITWPGRERRLIAATDGHARHVVYSRT
jgi:hypothetical protein